MNGYEIIISLFGEFICAISICLISLLFVRLLFKNCLSAKFESMNDQIEAIIKIIIASAIGLILGYALHLLYGWLFNVAYHFAWGTAGGLVGSLFALLIEYLQKNKSLSDVKADLSKAAETLKGIKALAIANGISDEKVNDYLAKAGTALSNKVEAVENAKAETLITNLVNAEYELLIKSKVIDGHLSVQDNIDLKRAGISDIYMKTSPAMLDFLNGK